MQSTIQNSLHRTLRSFAAQCNQSKAVKKFIASWDRQVEVRSLDTTESYSLITKAAQVQVATADDGECSQLTITADQEILEQVFSGELNPARAHLDGELQVYGSQKDQLILDAIVMLIWGF